jgi:nucleoside-diphosphate-sugar epimerase
MAILITGVGAVGSHVAAKLQSMGEQVVLYDLRPQIEFIGTLVDLERATMVVGDVNDVDLLAATIEAEHVETIVHLAGFLTRDLLKNPYGGVTLNLVGTASVLEAARRGCIRRVVFTSTRGVNQIAPPPADGGPLSEDFVMRVLRDRPKTMYELTKLTGEYLGLLYADLYDVEFVALRLGGGFGPTPGPPSGLTGGVLRPLVYGALSGGPVVISDPKLAYAGHHEFIYFKDDAEALALACTRQSLRQSVYNIRMDTTYTYDEVLDTVRRIIPGADIRNETSATMSMSPGRAPREDFADTTAARDELGWRPAYDLEAGIRDWMAWITAHDSGKQSTPVGYGRQA